VTRIARDAIASLLVAAMLAAAISVVWWAMLTKARADGLLLPPPPPAYELPPPGAGVLPYTLPYRQGPPTRSCVETAIQLGYQTGNRYVANAAVAACRAYAPVQYPRKYPPPMPLGSY
jgi:hypothetical protein